MSESNEMILILDFGSQYTQLIARRIREENIYCEIVPYNTDLTSYNKRPIKGYILSGGPASVTEPDSPRLDKSFFETDKPILGVCYGMQLMASLLGGELVKSKNREYGQSHITVNTESRLFKGVEINSRVWMSHGDSIISFPDNYNVIASTETVKIAAVENNDKNIFGLQFHPEVAHTDKGKKILHNFLFDICNCSGNWTTESFIQSTVNDLKVRLKDKKVVLAIS
ncbi:MAG: glutamine-hydrolyzing GMP synthase, partial [candidate division Zixibacteria bacterium]|nr:glutamine-hydrolyzing GMP synthase [candidate division Zixibacteria bacterium]